MAEYEYDSWGNCTILKNTDNIANTNPLRYRGYYYDSDTNLYYLQSRYYDANIGRFINADEVVFLGANGGVVSNNLFAYCDNNPVNNVDSTGHIAANIVGAVIGAIVGAVGGYFLTNWIANKLGLKSWKRKLFVWGLTAVISAAATTVGYFIGPYIAKISNKLISAIRYSFKPKFGTKIGRLGTLVKNTKPTIKGLTNHGLNRMAERGISKKLAQQIVKNGYAISQSGGKVLYFTKAGVVVLNQSGQVVTAYSAKYFDIAMQGIIKLFFG